MYTHVYVCVHSTSRDKQYATVSVPSVILVMTHALASYS